MNINFENGKSVTISPNWKDGQGNTSTKPAGIKLICNDPSVKVVDNGDGTWTMTPQRNGHYGVSAQFVTPINSATQSSKKELVDNTAITVAPTVQI